MGTRQILATSLCLAALLASYLPVMAKAGSNHSEPAETWLMDTSYLAADKNVDHKLIVDSNPATTDLQKKSKSHEIHGGGDELRRVDHHDGKYGAITCLTVRNQKKNTITYIDILSPKSENALGTPKPHTFSRAINDSQPLNSVDSKASL